ncbi:MAG TPA: hypothetical protein VN853_15190 [Polyangia bacterium]|jgi:hypothetical protein|nr:hypothetical protein [Polyangia bacterium]
MNLPDLPSSRLAVAREMISTLETLTNAGQRHFMAKVVVFIEGQVAAAGEVSEDDRDAALQSLEQLRRESARPLPDVVTFRNRADDLIGLLAPALSERVAS